MKKAVLFLLFILPILGFGQNITVPLPPGLVYKQDLDKISARIDSLARVVAGGIKPPPIVTPIDSCPRGPSIEGISKITGTSSELNFDAEGVPKINYVILNEAGNLLYSDSLIDLQTNRVPFKYNPLAEGSYYLRIQGRNCVSKPSTRKFTIRGDLPPPVVNPPVGKSKSIGAESIKVGARFYTYNQTGKLVLKFNEDGTISDVTPGLDNSGSIATLDGKKVYYMVGDYWHETPDGQYQNFQNIPLPDGRFTIKQYVCDPLKISNYSTFKENLSNNTDKGVHELNAYLSQSFVSIKSDVKVGNGIGGDWLVVSRVMNFPKVLPSMDLRPYGKYFAVSWVNRGDGQEVIQRVGALPYVRPGQPNQERTWQTVKTGQSVVLTPHQAYNYGYEWAGYMGYSKDAYITAELVENGQGQYDDGDPQDGYSVAYNFAKGNLDAIRSRNPGIDAGQTGIHGEYGGDNYYGLLNESLLFGSRENYVKSMTTALYKGYGKEGFGTEDHDYYKKGHIDVRHANAKYYFWGRVYQLPYEFIFLKERFALATKTYGGKDRLRNISIFSSPIIESFVERWGYGKINIEEALTGEVFEFPNGTMLTKMNTQPPAPWDELFTASFWGHLIGDGIAMWDANGNNFGSDVTKINWGETDQWAAWRPKGQSGYQRYVSGKDGAPINSSEGLSNSLWAPVMDASAAGMEAYYDIRNRTAKKSFTSYRSSAGEFIAKPGTAGYILNGDGPPNYNSFTVKDAYDQKKGLALVGEGPEGVVLIYYNGFMSAHNFEDNVIIRYAGTDYNLGKIWGRQTVIKKL